MNLIKKNILEKELSYDGTVVLKYHIEYPIVVASKSQNGALAFNKYNEELAFELRDKAENELFKEAVGLYNHNKQNGYPIMTYEINSIFKITYNTNNIVSLYVDEYTFSGGAHGNTVRTSQNWNLIEGTLIPLEALFPNNPYFLLSLLKQINSQIANNKDVFFENSCNLVLETFNPKNFYLTQNGFIIYFQQYDIAPYSSGIPTFQFYY